MIYELTSILLGLFMRTGIVVYRTKQKLISTLSFLIKFNYFENKNHYIQNNRGRKNAFKLLFVNNYSFQC